MSVITISPVLPHMAEEFSDVENSEFLVKLVLTLPALFIAIMSPIAGRLIDKYGRVRILWMSLILYALSGAAGYFLNNLYHLLVSRAILGISVGMSMTIAITLIADYFEGEERQKFVGIQVAFMSMGGILFISLGGYLTDIGWRFPFFIYLFSLLVLPFSIIYLQEPTIVEKEKRANPEVQSPGIIWLLFFNTMIMWIIFFLIPVQLPFHIKAIGIEKNTLTGFAIAASTAFSAVSAVFYSKIKGRFSFLTIFSVGYLLMASGFASLAISENYTMVIIAMMLSGLGMGMMIPNTNMWVMKLAPSEIRGKEIGKLTTFWFLGQFLSPIILFPILSNLSLSSTFMVAAGILFLMSSGFIIMHFGKIERPVSQ